MGRPDVPVEVAGLREDGAVVFVAELPHGADPATLAYERGFVVDRPVAARRAGPGRLRLELRVRPAAGEAAPPVRGRGRDHDLVVNPDVPPLLRQRVAAYAVIVSERGLLATEFSDRTAVAGRWGLPGGGLDDEEEPADAVLREVLEETSQQVSLGPLVRVHTSHWVGRSPRAEIEDFHAVRLVYRGTCDAPSEPVIVDQDGTTSAALWIGLDRWRALPWTANWREVLGELLT